MNTFDEKQIIIKYLQYLKAISRKIGLQYSFEKSLLDSSKKNPLFTWQVDYIPEVVTKNNDKELFEHLEKIDAYLKSNSDRKLFFGIGLICGDAKKSVSKNKKDNERERYKKIISAPLVFMQCDFYKDDDNREFNINYDIDSLCLNHDCIASLCDSYTYNDDDYNPSYDEEIVIFEKAEKEIEDIINVFNNVSEIKVLIDDIFDIFHEKIKNFSTITKEKEYKYNFKKESDLYKNKSKIQKSIFEDELRYIRAEDACHFFVAQLPNDLSTFNALKTLITEVDTYDFRNKMLKSLLVNALTDTKIPLERISEIDKIKPVLELIPMELSKMQHDAIKNSWTNSISYIHGPPGSGKSYTISAILLSAVYLGKKVLVVSQKKPALEVVKNKTEPYLNYNDKIQGVVYFDRDAKNKIREHIKELKKHHGDYKGISYIKDKIEKCMADIEEITKEISDLYERLRGNLSKEYIHISENKGFVNERDRFIGKYKGIISQSYKFRRNIEFPYGNCMEKVKRITSSNSRSLSSKNYLTRFTRKISSLYDLDIQIDDNYYNKIYDVSNDIIKLHEIFTRIKNPMSNSNLIRIKIKEKEGDLCNIQKKVLKYQREYNSESLLRDRNIEEELDKFDKMLYNRRADLIKKKMGDIDFSKIIDIMPLWAAEIRHLGEIFPMEPELFDMVIVDEASQVNLAEVLPAFYRGKRICIVGDHNQLSLSSTGLTFQLSNKLDTLSWTKYKHDMNYQLACEKKITVTKSSILDFIKTDIFNVALPEVMLDEHYRSLPSLAAYTNKFYENKLSIMTETPDKIEINTFVPVRVQNGIRDDNKTIESEANEIIEIIESIVFNKNNNKYKNIQDILDVIIQREDKKIEDITIGIISFIRNQCTLIKGLIEEKIDDRYIKNHDIMCGTPEEFQGHERDIMILSLCLDKTCMRGSTHYQNKNRLNVATSRAKSLVIFVYSDIPQTYTEINNYYKHFTGISLDTQNTDNSKNNNVISYSPITWRFNFEKFESEFEKEVYSYLEKYINEHKEDAIEIFNQVKSCGQKRLDFVLYNHKNKKFVAVEVDGASHFIEGSNKEYCDAHIERVEILQRAGWKIIHTPYCLWYNNGWLSDIGHPNFKQEIDRIYKELDNHLLNQIVSPYSQVVGHDGFVEKTVEVHDTVEIKNGEPIITETLDKVLSRFTDNNNGTATDNTTGLIWLKNANCFGVMNWNNAMLKAKTLQSGACGLTDGSRVGDWRLPYVGELKSLYEEIKNNRYPFIRVQSGYYWSSSTYANDTSDAWVVGMSHGYVGFGDKVGHRHYVWPVRAGQ